ncbi:DNA-3-methyladenine glycosylase I [Spirochaeta cellobiosiphila]|uniref:DNA-3-methyladenine glycosylase I n=1 Tax=Spirochaeta cellobiosiphila TaxID=504483 RepID=UPI0004146FDA|nr:DNA-3-methyladenine glycosylase I [Spirochaeta cellobiosiphila]
MIRCGWVPEDKELYIQYHDQEWGVPVHDDRTFFEFLILEGAQAGLSWYTVLRKREAYRQAFDDFDPQIVAQYDEAKVAELLANQGIIRNKLKIGSAIKNAKAFLQIQTEWKSFDRFIWNYVDNKPIVNNFPKLSDVPASTELSERISKDLKKRGMSFVGTTIIYSFLQATGIVNDHTTDCYRYKEVQKL